MKLTPENIRVLKALAYGVIAITILWFLVETFFPAPFPHQAF